MSSFILLPQLTGPEAYHQKLNNAFSVRGFNSPETILCGPYQLTWYPGLGGRTDTLYKDDKGNVLAISGTCFYRQQLLQSGTEDLLHKIFTGNIQAGDFQGTFCLIAYNAEEKKNYILHDSYGNFRFYRDSQSNAISSSFTALAMASDSLNIYEDIINFNLIFGFNPSTHTWDKKIHRVLSSSDLPSDIAYQRVPDTDKKYSFSSFDEALESSATLLSEKMNIVENDHQINTFLGLSSGFDSRLMAALLSNKAVRDLTYFTFHKPGASDPVIATRIAELSGKKLLRKDTSRSSTYEEQAKTFTNAWHFFDSHAVTMMQYSKPDYTAGFRKDVLGNNALHLSGVGGELFRNYNYDHGMTTSVQDWVRAYLLAGHTPGDFIKGKDQSSIMKILTEYLETALQVKDRISFRQRKQFYGSLFLRDWHSVRNSVENQYSYYYTPFTDPEVIRMSYASAPFHGRAGKFEGQLISRLSPELARLPSGYGFSLDSYPFKPMIKDTLRAMVKTPLLMKFRKSVKPEAAYQPTEFEKDQLSVFSKIGLNINVPVMLSSSKRVEPLLSTAFALKQLTGL